MSEISERFRDLAAKFTKHVDAVPDNRWASASPCEGWTARDVVRHLVEWVPFFFSRAGIEFPVSVSVDDDPAKAWAQLRDALQAKLDDPAAASTEYEVFMGKSTFEQGVSQFMFIDLIVHSWDLARAAGLEEQLDPADVHWAFETVKPLDEMMRTPGVCGPKVDTPPGADEQVEFLAFMGRRV